MSKQKLDDLGVSAFCESMAMMVRSGIQTDEAISLLQSSGKSGGILEQGLSVMKEQVGQGFGLASAMKESGIFPDYALQIAPDGWRISCFDWPDIMRTRRPFPKSCITPSLIPRPCCP